MDHVQEKNKLIVRALTPQVRSGGEFGIIPRGGAPPVMFVIHIYIYIMYHISTINHSY